MNLFLKHEKNIPEYILLEDKFYLLIKTIFAVFRGIIRIVLNVRTIFASKISELEWI